MSDFLIHDFGLFVELASRLAGDGHSVRYYNPWEAVVPRLAETVLGDGIEGVRRVADFFQALRDSRPDAVVFPDTLHSGLQLFLESNDYPVWGSRTADELELRRAGLRADLSRMGFKTAPWTVARGVSALREVLQRVGVAWVKTSSRFRADLETWKYEDPVAGEAELKRLTVALGPAAESLLFLVESPAEGVEAGLDTFSVDGRWPDRVILGYEVKDRGYAGEVVAWADMPKQITGIAGALSPFLAERRCRNFVSLEIRVTPQGEGILIDPCVRAPCPGLGVEMRLISNLSDVILQGAGGQLVQPEYAARCGVQAVLNWKGGSACWRPLAVPANVREALCLAEFCRVGGVDWVVPRQPSRPAVGWVVAVADTYEDALDRAEAVAEELGPLPVSVDLEAAREAVEIARSANEYYRAGAAGREGGDATGA